MGGSEEKSNEENKRTTTRKAASITITMRAPCVKVCEQFREEIYSNLLCVVSIVRCILISSAQEKKATPHTAVCHVCIRFS